MAMHRTSSASDGMFDKRLWTPRRVPKRPILVAAAVLIAGAAAWYSWSWWTLGRFKETTDDAYVGGEITTIASKVAGLVETVAITDNQTIKAGVVKLDDRVHDLRT
jgi:membrane fusion protein, multidrug efflux system